MGTINIYSVRNALEEEGWKLISDTYKNLKTDLEMECPKGHRQVLTFEKWRKHPLCDACLAGDPYKVKNNKVPPKQDDTTRILALDAATGTTGYAVYDNKVLVHYGTFKTNSSYDPAARINQVKHWLKAALKEWEPDFVGVENIQLQHYGKDGNQNLKRVQIMNQYVQVNGAVIAELMMVILIVMPRKLRHRVRLKFGMIQIALKMKQMQFVSANIFAGKLKQVKSHGVKIQYDYC